MLNPSSGNTNLQGLVGIEAVRPDNAGMDWKGVPHADLLRVTLKRLRGMVWETEPPVVHLSRGHADMVASIAVVRDPKQPYLADGLKPALGIAVSNDRRRQLTFYVGATSTDAEGTDSICTDCFLAGKRYVTSFNLDSEVETALGKWEDATDRLGKQIARLKAKKIKPVEVTELLMEAGERGLMPNSRIVKAIREAKNREVTDRFGLTLAFGRITGQNAATTQLDQLLGFYRLMSAPEPAKLATAS